MLRYTPICILLAAAACSNENDAPDLDDPNAARGQVTGEVSSESDVDTVTAFRVAVDGSLLAASEPAEVESDGSYTVEVVLDGDTDGELIIADSEGSLDAAVIVSGTVEENTTVAAGEIDDETSLESRVLVELTTDGAFEQGDERVGLLRALITSDVTTAAQTDSDQNGSVDLLADATLGVMTSLDMAPAELNVMDQNEAAADLTGDDTSVSLSSLADAGLTTDDLSLRVHTAAETAASIAAEGESNAQAGAMAMVWTSEHLRGEVAISTISKLVTDLNLGATAESSVQDTNDGLLDGFLDADIGGELMLDLSSSWEAWTSGLDTAIVASLSLDTQATVQSAQVAATDAEAELETAIDAAVSTHAEAEARAMAIMDAMAEYETQIWADARVTALSETDLGSSGADAMTEILVQTHASVQ